MVRDGMVRWERRATMVLRVLAAAAGAAGESDKRMCVGVAAAAAAAVVAPPGGGPTQGVLGSEKDVDVLALVLLAGTKP